MNKKFTALLMALLLALTLCSPALAGAEYGSFYDETEQISSDELTNLGEETFPQLSKTLGVDLRVDVFTDEGVEDSTVWDIATYVYGNSDYGLGEEKEGISLTLLLRAQPDGSYAMAEKDWCVYVSLSQARGNAQELTDVVSDAVKPYMAERAWNRRTASAKPPKRRKRPRSRSRNRSRNRRRTAPTKPPKRRTWTRKAPR